MIAEIIWSSASIILGLVVFYFAQFYKRIEDNKRGAIGLFGGILLAMGTFCLLLVMGQLCGECSKYCKECELPKPEKNDTMNLS